MGALVTQVERDPVALSDHRVKVRERAPPSTNPGLRLFGELAARLIDNFKDAAVERFIDEAVDVRLIGLNPSRLRRPVNHDHCATTTQPQHRDHGVGFGGGVACEARRYRTPRCRSNHASYPETMTALGTESHTGA